MQLNWDEANAPALVKATNPPDSVPLFEEIVFSPGYNNFACGDTIAHNLVDPGDPPCQIKDYERQYNGARPLLLRDCFPLNPSEAPVLPLPDTLGIKERQFGFFPDQQGHFLVRAAGFLD